MTTARIAGGAPHMARRFSVIIPLEFHRGHIESSLRRWTRGQTYPREHYEVVAAGWVLARCRCALRCLARDRARPAPVVRRASRHRADRVCRSGGRGRGPHLHGIALPPRPDFLARADDSLREHPDWAGFSGCSLRITQNRLSIVEADMYEADIRHGMEEHLWRKILDQCFVVRKGAYDEAGGFRAALGHFAEWHLAARMHSKGDRIGYAPLVRVWHHYVGDCRELVEFSTDFARGEMTYHATFAEDPVKRTSTSQWSGRAAISGRRPSRMRRSCWRGGALQDRRRIAAPAEVARRLRLLLAWTVRASFGAAPDLLRAFVRFQSALWGLRLAMRLGADRTTLEAALIWLVDASVRLERMRFVRRWLSGDEPRLRPPTCRDPVADVAARERERLSLGRFLSAGGLAGTSVPLVRAGRHDRSRPDAGRLSLHSGMAAGEAAREPEGVA